MSSKVLKTSNKKPVDSKSLGLTEESKGPYAVVLANRDGVRFRPLSDTIPDCLIPICNVPVIHFLLLRLITDGFKDILIYACSHFVQVQDFVRTNSYSGSRIHVYNGEGNLSLGDIMRDLDTMQSLRGVSDFLLVPADLLCSVPLLPFLRSHELRRSHNPNAILTLVLSPVPPCVGRSQAAEWGVNVLFSRTSGNRLIRWSHAIDTSSTSLMVSEFARMDRCVELASDLVDLGITVCSTHVPALFQDNFDYENMGDLIQEVLTNEEIMGYSIHVDSVDPGPIVVRIAPDLMSAINISSWLLGRKGGLSWLCPPLLLPTEHQYECFGPQVYVSKTAELNPNANLVGACIIGPGCKIGDSACLVDCILGSDCVVGENTRLRRVVGLDSVTIGSHVRADTAWICARARILDRMHLPFACFVGPSENSVVTLGPGRGDLPKKCVLVAPAATGLVLEPEIGGDQVWASFYSQDERPHSVRVTGHSLSTDPPSTDSETDTTHQLPGVHNVNHIPNLWDTAEDRLRVAAKKLRACAARVTSASNEWNRPASKSCSRRSRVDSIHNAVSDDESIGEGEHSEAFLISELCRTLEHSQDAGHEALSNLTLEVNSLKHAYNIPIEDLYFLLIKAIFELAISSASVSKISEATTAEVRLFISEFQRQVTRFHSLLKSYLSTSDDDGRVCLQVLEDTACERSIVMSASPFLAHALYENDLVTEPAVWWWLDHSPLLSDPELSVQTKLLREKLNPFLTWLKEAEEEADSDSDSES